MAAVETEEAIDIHFVGCDEVRGFLWTWNKTVYPDPTEAMAVLEPVAAAWSSALPISSRSYAVAIPGQLYVVRLLGPDGSSVLYERDFDIQIHPGTSERYFVLDVTLDCSVIPYRQGAFPDTAISVSEAPPSLPWPGLGLVLIGAAALLAGLRRLGPVRRL